MTWTDSSGATEGDQCNLNKAACGAGAARSWRHAKAVLAAAAGQGGAMEDRQADLAGSGSCFGHRRLNFI
jgi:hypothetical protein